MINHNTIFNLYLDIHYITNNKILWIIQNNICPVCKGTGKQELTVTRAFSDEPDEKSTITCVWCDGEELSESDVKYIQNQIDFENEMWCKCENQDDVKYIPDTKNMKHHWICNDCNKVVQIG